MPWSPRAAAYPARPGSRLSAPSRGSDQEEFPQSQPSVGHNPADVDLLVEGDISFVHDGATDAGGKAKPGVPAAEFNQETGVVHDDSIDPPLNQLPWAATQMARREASAPTCSAV